MAVRRQIVRTFKKHQLTLQLDATEYLEETLEAQDIPAEDLNDTLENIAAGYVAREGTRRLCWSKNPDSGQGHRIANTIPFVHLP